MHMRALRYWSVISSRVTLVHATRVTSHADRSQPVLLSVLFLGGDPDFGDPGRVAVAAAAGVRCLAAKGVGCSTL